MVPFRDLTICDAACDTGKSPKAPSFYMGNSGEIRESLQQIDEKGNQLVVQGPQMFPFQTAVLQNKKRYRRRRE